jgi:hypothetical protein
MNSSSSGAASRARQIIHDNDVEQLKQLLAEHPALLAWRDEANEGGLLGMATGAWADAGDPERKQWYTRAACAEVLIDAGATLSPSVCDGLLQSHAKGLLQLFERKGLLPRTLKFRVALEDLEGVRALIDGGGDDYATVEVALRVACGFEHEPMASVLLDRLTALDPELGKRIDAGPGRAAFIKGLIDGKQLLDVGPADPWQTFLMRQVARALRDDDLTGFVRHLQSEPWLLGEARVGFQVRLVEYAASNDLGAFITALYDLEPALLRRRPPPRSQAIEFVFNYGKTHLLPLLTRVWPIPDDLVHAAGLGDLDRVKAWFNASGQPALGDLSKQFPCNDAYNRGNLQWGAPQARQALDTALAWAMLEHHFDVADFLLQHGADINTRWSTHEPASILHELVFRDDYEAMQFLIDRGIDMTIEDYRWGGTAADWAHHAKNDPKMVQWLEDAQQRQEQRR